MNKKRFISYLFLLCFPITLLGQKGLNDTTYILTYDHGGLILWGGEHFIERLKNATEWLDKYPSFKIGLDNEAQIYDHFAEDEPHLLKEMKDILSAYDGRIGIGSCTYGQPLSQFISDESNIRQIAYALDSERKIFNYRPPVYLMSEHAMHSQIPQIINGFGFDGAIMRTHFMMYGYNPTFNYPIGLWEGIDGSRISTIPTYEGEGAAFGKTTVDTWILTRYPSKDAPLSLDDYRKQFQHINPLLASRADDSGLRREALVAEYDKKPKFQFILLDELLRKYPQATDIMRTRPNDFTVRMPWGYCGNEIWNESRKAEVEILIAERLAAFSKMYGGEAFENDLDKAWKDLLLAQHHDIQIVGLIPEARKLLPRSYETSNQVIEKSMNFFANQMKGEGLKQVTVFNPLSWEHSPWVMAYISLHKGEAKNFIVRSGNKSYPAYVVNSNEYSDGSLLDAFVIFKPDLKPLSLTSFSIMAAEPEMNNPVDNIQYDEENLIIRTPFYNLKLNEKGGFDYLKSSKGQVIFNNNQAKCAFFEGTIDGSVQVSEGRWSIYKSKGYMPWIKLVEHGYIDDIPYTYEVMLYEDKPVIDCKVSFDFNGQMIGHPTEDKRDWHSGFIHEEKLRFKLFHQLEKTSVGVRDLPFAISETSDKYIEGNYWTALTDGDNGIAIFNKGNMGSIKEDEQCLSISLAFSHYYVWGIRPLYGKYSYEFALYPFQGDWKQADLTKRSLEYAFQTPSVQTIKTSNTMDCELQPLNASLENDVILTALYPNKGGIWARYFKYGELTKSSSVKFNTQNTVLNEIDLDGNILQSGVKDLHLSPWQIKTVKMNMK